MDNGIINGEVWKGIKGYEDVYEVSDFGRFRSLDRIITNSLGVQTKVKGQLIKLEVTKAGYNRARLWRNQKVNRISIHRLVYLTFVGEIPSDKQVDHIDNNKLNNRVDNLQLLSPRQNTYKARQRIKNQQSKYIGVTQCTTDPNKWVSRITIDGVRTYLGLFDSQEKAYEAFKTKAEEFGIKWTISEK